MKVTVPTTVALALFSGTLKVAGVTTGGLLPKCPATGSSPTAPKPAIVVSGGP